jgi:hypothetical protein
MAQRINTANVSEEMLSRATRVLDFQARQVFYLVENSRGEVNDQGEVICYQVRYNKDRHILQCRAHNGLACKASEFGMTCQHMRIAVKSAELFKAELKARAAEQERLMRAFSLEIESDSRELILDSCAPYTVEVDQTSSSLDAITRWEMAPSGRMVPMR